MASQFGDILRVLVQHRVRFVIVGGVAGAIHGSSRATYDIDLVYDRKRDNVERLVSALQPLDPYLRDAPPDLPFRFDVQTVLSGLNFTLTTSLGALDLFGETVGGATYTRLVKHSDEVEVSGVRCLCVDIERLIEMKRASGRPRDFDAIAELKAILDARLRGGQTKK